MEGESLNKLDPFERQIVIDHLVPVFSSLQDAVEGETMIKALVGSLMLGAGSLNQIAARHPELGEDPGFVLAREYFRLAYRTFYEWYIDNEKKRIRESN